MITLFKVCGRCGIGKNVSEYHLRKKNGKSNPRMECKSCYREDRRLKYITNKTKILDRNRAYIQSRTEYKSNYDKNRYHANKKKVNKGNLLRYHKRFDSDVDFRILRAMRARVYFAIKGGKKCMKTVELIGCSIEFLKEYLVSKFSVGMNWGNYGRDGWHVDHIVPCDSFDMSNEEQQKRCFNFKNLQPLWGKDNLKKGKKLNNDTNSFSDYCR